MGARVPQVQGTGPVPHLEQGTRKGEGRQGHLGFVVHVLMIVFTSYLTVSSRHLHRSSVQPHPLLRSLRRQQGSRASLLVPRSGSRVLLQNPDPSLSTREPQVLQVAPRERGFILRSTGGAFLLGIFFSLYKTLVSLAECSQTRRSSRPLDSLLPGESRLTILA